MDNPQHIRAFLKKPAPALRRTIAYIGKHMGIDSDEVTTIGWTLALFPKEFKRRHGVCPHLCSSRTKDLTESI